MWLKFKCPILDMRVGEFLMCKFSLFYYCNELQCIVSLERKMISFYSYFVCMQSIPKHSLCKARQHSL
jgi:hypothetical protein